VTAARSGGAEACRGEEDGAAKADMAAEAGSNVRCRRRRNSSERLKSSSGGGSLPGAGRGVHVPGGRPKWEPPAHLVRPPAAVATWALWAQGGAEAGMPCAGGNGVGLRLRAGPLDTLSR